MRKYNSNLSFVDMLFNLLVGFTSLFILAFLLINPIADEGKIDPVTQFMINLRWDDHLPVDLDVHIRTPTGQIVSFRMKDNGWVVLNRDDLGNISDRYLVDGESRLVAKNMEVVTIDDIVPGEYVVNVHYYGCQCETFQGEVDIRNDMSFSMEIIDMHPFKVKLDRDVTGLGLRDEVTVATFVVDEDGNIGDIRTDIFIRLYGSGGGTGP